MKRSAAVLAAILTVAFSVKAHREFIQLEKDINYVNDHSLNSKPARISGLKDAVKEKSAPLKKNPEKRQAMTKELSPKEIMASAGYLVKVRIFKPVVVPPTQQILYLDEHGFGSGTVVRCEKYKYCVLTAFHVGDDASMAYFAEAKDGSVAQKLELIGGTTTNDAELFRFTDTSYVPKSIATLGDSDPEKLPAGSRVCAIGSDSFGDFWISVGYTYHSVLNPAGSFKENLKSNQLYHKYVIPTDAKLYRGYSGGPLVNEYGRIVGINVSVTELDWHVIHITIPINEIKKEFKILK